MYNSTQPYQRPQKMPKAFIGTVVLVLLGLAVSASSKLWQFNQVEKVRAQESQAVVIATPLNLSRVLKVNVPSFFRELVTMTVLEVEGESIFGGEVSFENDVTFDGQISLSSDVFAGGINIDLGSGELTASNVIYSLEAGSGIRISDGQSPTISATDLGTAQNIFKKIKVGSDTAEADENSDTLELAAGSGISVSIDTGTDKLTITNSALPGFVKSGTYALLADGVTRVGVGTATPGNTFEVDSGTDGLSGFSFTRLTSSSTAGIGGGKVLSLDSGGRIILVADQTGDSTPSAEAILPSATNGMTLYFNGTNWAASDNLFHDGGSVGVSNATPVSRLHVNTNLASKIGVIVQGYAAQSANLQEWRDSTGSTLSYIDQNGVFNGSANVTGSLNPGLTNGSVLFQGPSGITQDNTNFFWDDTNKRLGIGSGSTVPDPLSVFSANQLLSTGRGQIGAYSTDSQAANLGGQLVLGGQDGLGRRSFAAVAGRKENSTSGDRSGYLQFSTRATGPGTTDLTERMRITSGGNVGIGTTSPNAVLDLKATADGVNFLRFTTSGTPHFSFRQDTSGANPDLGIYSADTLVMKFFDAGVDTIQLPGELSLGTFNTTNVLTVRGGAAIGTAATYYSGTAPSNGMIVEGNVGMGTVSPNHPLHIVNNTLNNSPLLNIESANDAYLRLDSGGGVDDFSQLAFSKLGTAKANIFVNDSTDDDLYLRGTGTSDLILLNTGGNVGIGTTAPDALLTLQQDFSPTIKLSGTRTADADFGELQFYNRAGAAIGGQILATRNGANNTSVLRFTTNNAGTLTEKMRIDNIGRVGIGTTVPGARLDVVGDLFAPVATFSANYAAGVPLTVKGGPSGTGLLTRWQNSAGTVLSVVDEAGEFGIGDTTPVSKLAIGEDSGFNGSLYVGAVGANANRLANFGNALEITSGAGPSWTGQGIRVDGTNRTLQLIGSAANATDNYLFSINSGGGVLFNAPTSGSKGLVDFGSSVNFAPTSGTATYAVLDIRSTINQTGGANGITRGIYINPTLTAAVDWRGVEIANNSGYGIYQSGASALNYFAGETRIGTVSDLGFSTTSVLDVNGAIGLPSSGVLLASGGNGVLGRTGNIYYFQAPATGNFFQLRNNLGTPLVNVDNNGNVGIGATAFGTSAVNALAIAGSTAPSTSITDGIQLFAVDVAGSHELQVRDEAGNTTTLSPHNFSVIGQSSEQLAWSFYSERNSLAINADMTKALRVVEKLSGEKLVYLKDLTTGQLLEDESDATKITELADNGSIGDIAKWNYQLWTFVGEVIFEKPAQFLAQVTFRGKAVFAAETWFGNRVTFADKDMAGFAEIPAGAQEVSILFAKPFAEKPVITVTPDGEAVEYSLQATSTTGFTIRLVQPATELKTFNWMAVLVEDATTTTGTVPQSSPQPTDQPAAPSMATPGPISQPSSTPEPSSPSPTPLSTSSPTPEPSTSPTSTESATLITQ